MAEHGGSEGAQTTQAFKGAGRRRGEAGGTSGGRTEDQLEFTHLADGWAGPSAGILSFNSPPTTDVD